MIKIKAWSMVHHYLNNCVCIATWQLITFIRMFTFCKQTRVDVGLYANITLAVCSGKLGQQANTFGENKPDVMDSRVILDTHFVYMSFSKCTSSVQP